MISDLSDSPMRRANNFAAAAVFRAALCCVPVLTTAAAGQQADPEPTYDNLLACGSLWIYPRHTPANVIRVVEDDRCGHLLVSAALNRPQAGVQLNVDIVVGAVTDTLRLPLRIFIDPDSTVSFKGDTTRLGRDHGVGFGLWNDEFGNYDLFEVFDSYRHHMWRLFRESLDTIQGALLYPGQATAPRTINLTLAPDKLSDSVRIPFRIQGYRPAAPISVAPPILNRASQLGNLPIVDDPRLLPHQFYEGIVVVGFSPRASPLARQLIMDRLEGTVIAYAPRSGPEPDFLVRVGPNWRDSLLQVSPVRKLDRSVRRFGVLLVTPGPSMRPSRPGGLPQATATAVKDPCSNKEDRLTRRRLAYVGLAGATPTERAEVAALIHGRWLTRRKGERWDRLELTGTVGEVRSQLDMILRLPQVDFTMVTSDLACATVS